MLPSNSEILAEAINTKILTKNHPDSPHSHPDLPHSHPNSPCSHPDSFVPTLIPRGPTLVFCIPTLILRVPIIPLIPFPDYLFRLLQISIFDE